MRLHVVRMTLELASPLHIGSGADDPLLDAPVVRDAFGDYRLPGSSIAGAARAFAERLGLDGVFGGGGEEARASAIEFSDGFVLDWDGVPVIEKRLRGETPALGHLLEVQEHVRIDHATGAAVEGGKFDTEIVPQGMRFRVEIAFQDRGSGGAEALGAIATALADGSIPLGGDSAAGLGLVKLVEGSASYDSFDLSTIPGIEAAAGLPASISAPCGQAGMPAGSHAGTMARQEASLGGWVRLRLVADGPILVGGSQRPSLGGKDGSDAALCDLVFGETLVADWTAGRFVARPWIPGSALRGAIRHRVWHVAEAIGLGNPAGIIDELFGTVDGARAIASKIRVFGDVLPACERTVVQHVAIDRLTGGSLQGALYSEAPIWRDDLLVDMEIRFEGLTTEQAVLLGHALLDLAEGDLPVGGGVNRGNGSLRIAESVDPSQGYSGRSVTFEVDFGGRRVRHTSPRSDLETLLGELEAVNAAMAGASGEGGGP